MVVVVVEEANEAAYYYYSKTSFSFLDQTPVFQVLSLGVVVIRGFLVPP